MIQFDFMLCFIQDKVKFTAVINRAARLYSKQVANMQDIIK